MKKLVIGFVTGTLSVLLLPVAAFAADLTVNGNVNGVTGLTVSGGTVLNGTTTINGNLNGVTGLTVGGGTVLNGTETVNGNVNGVTGLTVNGSSVLNGTLSGLTGLTVASGTVSLPNASVADAALSSNVALKNAANNFTAAQTVTGSADAVQLLVKGNSTQTNNVLALQNSAGTSLLTVANSGALTVVSGGATITAGGLTVSAGTVSLPAASIADAALSSNVPLKNAANTFTAAQTVNAASATALQLQAGGVAQFAFDTSAASPVNGLTFASKATGANPVVSATGSDTNIGIALTPKGTGQVSVTANGLSVTGNSTFTGTLSGLTGLTVASGGATITAGGLTITAGGLTVSAGGASITGATTLAGNVRQTGANPATYNAAAVNTLGTATATTADLLSNRVILHSAAANDTITTPTAAALVAALPGAAVGDVFTFNVSNSAAANTAALAGGSGVTVSGPGTVAAATSRVFYCRATNVTGGSEAFTCY